MSQSTNSDAAAILAELTAIKRLIVFALLNSGTSQSVVATALGVSQSHVSRMFPGAVRTGSPRKGQTK
jgi:predicted XRE-type DNA-binding protein